MIGAFSMPHKKKPPHEMTDRELLREVFPERVAEEIEKEVSESDSPDKEKDK